MIYIDISALTKLVLTEAESGALIDWLNAHDDHYVTSALTRVELLRTVIRYDTPGAVEQAHTVLDGLDIIPITDQVLTTAETIGPHTLRSLDAIHLASAAQLDTELSALIAYDSRMLDACHTVGIPTVTPADDQESDER